MTPMRSIYTLKNTIMTYSWGSYTALAELLGAPVPADIPQAELWMGAHPKASSMIEVEGKPISLIDAIDQNPVAMLGESAAGRFDNRLPYLFKVLAVNRPLSIQAHPSRTQAKKGFSREKALNIPFDAPHRNYRDNNHKPECICALTDFWVLCGFRPVSQTVSLLQSACPQTLAPEIDKLKQHSDEGGLQRFLEALLMMAESRKRAAIAEATSHTDSRGLSPPVGQWIIRLVDVYPNDIGALAPLFMNLTCLSAGEALFLPAGRFHAYLEGTGIELMANSDNVLRGGLTTKHVDVAELLTVLRFESTPVDPILPSQTGPLEVVYPTFANEFILSRITLGPDDTYKSNSGMGARIILCVEGNAVITAPATGEKVEIKKGLSVFVPGSVDGYTLSGKGVLYKAAVPIKKWLTCISGRC